MKIGLLFAGQGSQRAGMGADFYEEMPAFRAVFDLLPEDKKQLAWNGPEEALKETENTQPIMTAFGLGVWSCFREQGLRPDCAAGLSLGEYSALGASGAVDEDTAIRLVTRRGREMAKAAKGICCGMTAVLGRIRKRWNPAVKRHLKKVRSFRSPITTVPGRLSSPGRAGRWTGRPPWRKSGGPAAACRFRSAARFIRSI